MRAFGALAVGGLAGFFFLKLLAALVFPIFGFMVGLVGLVVKIGLWLAVGYVVYTLLKGRRKTSEDVA